MRTSPATRLRSQRGSASVELLGFLPLLLVAALAAWQILLATYAVTSASNAARTASRVQGTTEQRTDAARDSLPAALRHGLKVTVNGERSKVRVQIPIIVPGLTAGALRVTREAELPAT